MMEHSTGKPSFLKNIIVRLFLFGVLIVGVRFTYVITIRGESCDHADFCFFSLPDTVMGQLSTSSSSTSFSSNAPPRPKYPDLWATKNFQGSVQFYSSIFQDLISEGYLKPNSKALCVETQTGPDVFALKGLGVEDSVGIFKTASKPLVISGQGFKQPFKNSTFDFVFSGNGAIDKSLKLADFAAEICRTLRPAGFLVVHTASAKDAYSFISFVDLFDCCTLLRSRDIDGFDSSMPNIREIVMKKKIQNVIEIEPPSHGVKNPDDNSGNSCSVKGYKQEFIRNVEPLIKEEPLKPWIALKKNLKNIKYLASIVDISFKPRYVYIDVGARSYGSSIVSWFKKQYPKQNKTFEIYAIEADKTFHDQYQYKKGVTLLPYAAWVRNESLFFEINEDPGHKEVEKGRGMGRIQQGQSKGGSGGDVDMIQGFDFADWLKSTVSERDYVVMKMDVEGTEFDLIPRLFETGAICLVDEIFLECHYNRWQKCCPGKRSSKYQKTYGQCLDLFTSLRESGVLVHQWW